MTGDDAASGTDATGLSPDDVRRAVTRVLPDAEVRDATPVGEGKNTTCAVELGSGSDANGDSGADGDGGTDANEDGHPGADGDGDVNADEDGGAAGPDRELILKVGDHHFAAGCRAEPHVLEAVADCTDVPVPAVVGTGHLREHPYFIAERIPGANPTCDPQRLAPEAFERVCVDAGRHLGDLHATFSPDGWGMLGLDRGADGLHFAREFPDWPTYFEAWLSHNVERLADTRFADLEPALDERIPDLVADLRECGPFDPVLAHGDYRLGNLLVDPDTGETNAVVDWATPTATTAVHDLAVTEAVLVDWPEIPDDRQRRLRDRLYDEYRDTNSEVLDREDFEARRRLCGFGARLRLMVNLDEEMAGRPPGAVDDRAREHRDALREFGVE